MRSEAALSRCSAVCGFLLTAILFLFEYADSHVTRKRPSGDGFLLASQPHRYSRSSTRARVFFREALDWWLAPSGRVHAEWTGEAVSIQGRFPRRLYVHSEIIDDLRRFVPVSVPTRAC
uniref:Putative secreted protein n=1 Tax=Ixodes ricinus TaxID=34613 RepID=A0A147BWL6_IXORI